MTLLFYFHREISRCNKLMDSAVKAAHDIEIFWLSPSLLENLLLSNGRSPDVIILHPKISASFASIYLRYRGHEMIWQRKP